MRRRPAEFVPHRVRAGHKAIAVPAAFCVLLYGALPSAAEQLLVQVKGIRFQGTCEGKFKGSLPIKSFLKKSTIKAGIAATSQENTTGLSASPNPLRVRPRSNSYTNVTGQLTDPCKAGVVRVTASWIWRRANAQSTGVLFVNPLIHGKGNTPSPAFAAAGTGAFTYTAKFRCCFASGPYRITAIIRPNDNVRNVSATPRKFVCIRKETRNVTVAGALVDKTQWGQGRLRVVLAGRGSCITENIIEPAKKKPGQSWTGHAGGQSWAYHVTGQSRRYHRTSQSREIPTNERPRVAHATSQSRQTARLVGLIGTWVIRPYWIVNSEECGRVEYSATLHVTRQLAPNRYVGRHSFRWDMSRANPDCTFKFDRQGVVDADLHVQGNQVTIKYSNTGRNTFVDDHLVISGGTMNGTSNAGQSIIYSKR